ncbi:hypothetical protein Tco_1503629 [Tanacetum coccineum]
MDSRGRSSNHTLVDPLSECADTLLPLPPTYNTSPSLLLLSSFLRLGDEDRSRCILENMLVRFGLLDALWRRLGFSLPLRSPFLFGVLDSEYCELLLATADDNAYHSIPEGLRRTRAYLVLLRFALSLFPMCFARRTWVE